MNRVVKSNTRPVYLNLFLIHLPLTGWVSILHRVSGALLFAAFPLAVWGLSVSLTDEGAFLRLAEEGAHPLVRLLLLMLIWAVTHHWLAGLRHLMMDMHWGLNPGRARQSSIAVLLVAVMVTLVAAWRLFV